MCTCYARPSPSAVRRLLRLRVHLRGFDGGVVASHVFVGRRAADGGKDEDEDYLTLS